MKGMREIRNRIKAIKSTGQITHAMELVASSKMKRAQQNAEAGHPYAALLMDITDMAAECVAKGGRMDASRYFSNPNCGRRLIIVISTDKGLCGPLNSNLFKKISELGDECDFIAVGKRAERFLARSGRSVVNAMRISDKVEFSETRRIAKFASKLAAEGKVGSIEVLYSMYINTLKQEPTLVKLAPVDNLDWFIDRMRKMYKLKTEPRPEESRRINFEPSAAEIFSKLPAYYFTQALHQLALDAKASEQSARRVAMKAASDNADALVDSLTLDYNKARQAAITTEIQELAAAAAVSDEQL
ncbi:MAG: ATP synthase F1 subunit gamma [Verrucomicrobia bacterium]|nr:MAG: ATP synthase F1 subunit gamma [Verrucomicrobiota bacterium]